MTYLVSRSRVRAWVADALLRRTAPHLVKGAGGWISRHARLYAPEPRSLILGERVLIDQGAILMPQDGHIRIGSDCHVGPYSLLYGHGGLTIGNLVMIADHVTVIPANHIVRDPDLPMRAQGETSVGIVIEDDVWVGSHVTILDGVTVAAGAVLGAGAVVTRSVPPGAIVGGVPARVIGQRPAPGAAPGLDENV